MAQRKEIYRGRLISLNQEVVLLPDGSETTLDIVRHPGGAVIAPVTENGDICLLQQFRYAAGGDIWEFPAGCLDPGETPLTTAKRELAEETGLVAGDWTALGEMMSSPGFCDEVLYFFLARDLKPGLTRQSDDEFIEVHWLAIDEVVAMARRGDINDGKTLALLFRLLPLINNDIR